MGTSLASTGGWRPSAIALEVRLVVPYFVSRFQSQQDFLALFLVLFLLEIASFYYFALVTVVVVVIVVVVAVSLSLLLFVVLISPPPSSLFSLFRLPSPSVKSKHTTG